MSRRKPALALSWQRAVIDACGTPEAKRPEEPSIIAVAAVRALHADPDGSHCFPAQTTIARLAHVSPRTVKAVDAWLVERGLMTFTRRRARGLKEYRLTLPDTPTRTDLTPGPDTSTRTDLDPIRSTADRPQIDQVDLQPPTSDVRRREEEGREASADAPASAPSDRALRCARDIADRSQVVVDQVAVATAVDAFFARSGWAPDVVATVAADKAKKARSNPTAYVVAGLDALDPHAVALPDRLRVLNALERLYVLELQHEDVDAAECDRWAASAGSEWLEDEFVPHDSEHELAQHVEGLTERDLQDLEYRIDRQVERLEHRIALAEF